METILQDVLYSSRILLKKPAYPLLIIAILALCIGANTTVFSVIDAVLINPLPYESPKTLVNIFATDPQEGNDPSIKTISFPDYLDFKKSAIFADITLNDYGRYVLTGRGLHPEILLAARVSHNFFRLFGASPVAGRTFLQDEDRVEGPPVVMLSEGLWKDRFGRQNMEGKQIQLNDSLYTVIGVVPESFRLPSEFVDEERQVDLWLPVTPTGHNRGRGIRRFECYARLNTGTAIETARTKLETIAKNLQRAYPDSNEKIGVNAINLHDGIVKRSLSILFILLGSVLLVLLIGCANAANLMLSRATSRASEIAIRKALGASRIQIAQQLIVESVLLSLAAGILGLLIGTWGTDLFVSLYPGGIPRLYQAGMNVKVFAFNLGISLLTGFFFGLAPAWRWAGKDLAETMKGSASIDQPSEEKRTGKVLAVFEISLAVALAIGAGLLIRSFSRLLATDPGLQTSNLLTMKIVLPADQYPQPRAIEFYRELMERLDGHFGIDSSSAVHILPFGGGYSCDTFTRDDRPFPAGQEQCAEYRSVLPEYFSTIGISIVQGRAFTKEDRLGTSAVAIINEAMARKFWPEKNPIGMRVTSDTGERISRTIVGIVKDVKNFGLALPAEPELYIPFYQDPWPTTMTVILKTKQQPNSVIPVVRAQLESIDSNVPVDEIATMDELLSRSLAQPRFRTALLSSLAAIALMLAVLGIYGVVSYSTSRRTKEIGIRMALGARPGDVTQMVTSEGMLMAATGIIAGLLLGKILTQVLASFLYGVSTTDLVTYAGVSCLLASAAFLASYIPARRATKGSPLDALKYE